MKIIDFNSLGQAETSAPAADKVIAGHPQQQIWNAFSDPDGRFHVGRWASSAGTWRINYTERELCHLLTGAVRLTDDSGRQWDYTAGDTFMIDKGFSGTWEVIKPCSKIYAIYE
ncbi:MAG TPA: cupin domain-containing protein [Steroidobacteraceae bacterium]|nr:cupin domain-containing protein [Steroidobacteraceae bacterium]